MNVYETFSSIQASLLVYLTMDHKIKMMVFEQDILEVNHFKRKKELLAVRIIYHACQTENEHHI